MRRRTRRRIFELAFFYDRGLIGPEATVRAMARIVIDGLVEIAIRAVMAGGHFNIPHRRHAPTTAYERLEAARRA